MRRSITYALSGMVLALGAPAGWLLLQVGGLAGLGRAAEPLRAQPTLYAYMLVSTALVFALFGAVLGRREELLAAHDRKLAELARTDVLTGLANVRAFREALAREVARAGREHAPLALVMVDLDHFKRVNDTHGHAVGDQVLAHTARVLSLAVRAADLPARVGGEEFAILCPGADAAEATRIAERARAALESQPLIVAGQSVSVTASFGVAVQGASAEALFSAADAALYEAKRAGRNRVLTGAA